MSDAFHVPFSTRFRVGRACGHFPGPASVLLGTWLLTSCAVFPHRSHPAAAPAIAAAAKPLPPASASAAPTATPAPTAHRIGIVRVIGNAQRFVLVEVPPSATGTLPDGQLLRCTADPSAAAPATATLRVGRERRRPYVVADVVSGEPHVGDAVFTAAAPPASANTNTGPLVLPTATSGVLPIALPDATPIPVNSRP